MSGINETEDLIRVVRQNAEFKKKKSEVIRLLNIIEAQVLNNNEGYSITLVDELLLILKSEIEKISIKHEHILESIQLRLEEIINTKEVKDFESFISAKLLALKEFFSIYDNLLSFQNEYLNESVTLGSKEIEKELKKIRELRNSLQNVKSEDVYSSANIKFNNTKQTYIALLVLIMFITMVFSFSSMVMKNDLIQKFDVDIYDYWLLKITVISLLVTLISFLLRQVIHCQKKSDYAEKINLELKAFPSYIADLSAEDSIKLRKDLALKYFGNDQLEGVSSNNVNFEQIKASTDLVKASTEVIKSLK